ncbi:unnamed protein product [Adineta steineri]|uniref:G-protein coupled receptors family 1 profile domain-containing protein n=1 Tax=Adineta steineri TaxID=433720 RepID=A0A814TYW1_9BILA|nr:unnamed protein product [Adineta steineri]CAF1164702.1 unnamed protein product [Adineta steineri]
MNSSTSTQNLSNFQWTWSLRTIIVLIICGLITIVTILGNGLVLLSIKFRLRARSYSDYFIVSLCLADFFVGLFVMPLMTLHSIQLKWPFHYHYCYIWMSIDFTCSTASFLTLASMALDRYYALTAPYFHLRNRSRTSVLIFIISSWVIPFAIWPSSIVIAHYFNPKKTECNHPAHPYIIVILCTFFYYIPLLFMLCCYSRIIVNIKNIEVMIKGTWGTIKYNPTDYDYTNNVTNHHDYGPTNDKHNHTTTSSSQSNSSLRSLIVRYFQRNSSKPPFQNPIISGNDSPYNLSTNRSTRRGTLVNNSLTSTNLLPINVHRSNRQTTTATFTGQKRCLTDVIEEHRSKTDLLINQEEELVRTRLSTRTSSLPAARCVSYYYSQNQTVLQAKVFDDQSRSRLNSISNERSRSQSHSSSQGMANGGIITTDISDHSSSYDNVLDEDHRRLNRRNQQSNVSTSFNSSRYSQRAIAQFMHERNKARLRRNQKASRMLGILLAVFLICWLPFTISYPTMMFFPQFTEFAPQFESIIFWLGYVNSLLNPFLYVYSSRNFRKAIMETLCCCTRYKAREHLRYQWSVRS